MEHGNAVPATVHFHEDKTEWLSIKPNHYVLSKDELEEIILRSWKLCRDGKMPTETTNIILNNKQL